MRDRFGTGARRAAAALACAVVLECLTPGACHARALAPAEVEARAPRSVDRLRATIDVLASDALRGRERATPGSAAAQDFLVGELGSFAPGLDRGRAGGDAYRQTFGTSNTSGTNLLAGIAGRERPDEYVLIGAHYDHLGTRSAKDGRCSIVNPPGGKVCPGATDNAAGVAALLEIGRAVHALPVPPRRSIVLALWDGEEDGLLGSLHYVDHPVVPLGRTVAYVNFDILGADLLPSLAQMSFAVGAETGGARLEGAVRDAARGEAIDLQLMSTAFGQLRSDSTSFLTRLVPAVFFSDATGACYHTIGDGPHVVDLPKLVVETRIAYRVAVALAEAADAPAFSLPGLPPATHSDAVSLARVLDRVQSDRGSFRAENRDALQRLRAQVDAIVKQGAPSFGLLDGAALLAAAAQLMELTSGVPCTTSLPPAPGDAARLIR